MLFEYLLKLEIIVFSLSGAYILYYAWDKIVAYYIKLRIILNPNYIKDKKVKEEDIIEEKQEIKKTLKTDRETSDVNIEEYKKTKKITDEERSKLNEIIKKVKVHSQKSYFDSAKALIIEGLTIDKLNKELNLELARIYEEEKNYKHAEYIYRDIIDAVKNNDEILKKLGYILALQKRFLDSIDIYEKLFNKNAADMEVIELLSDLHYEVGNYEHSMKYVVLSLKEKPRNVERLIMKADLLKREGKNEDAIIAYKQVLDLQPYNSEAREGIKELERLLEKR